MKRHQGYTSKTDGLVCTECGGTVPEGDDCVMMEPNKAKRRKTHSTTVSVQRTAKSIHGVICMDCYDALGEEPILSAQEFSALMNLMMVSDPWPISDIEGDRIVDMLNEEARSRDYKDWVEAYHDMNE